MNDIDLGTKILSADSKSESYILIICRSAVRSIELMKYMGSILKRIKVTKLFAKHKKLEEQAEAISKAPLKLAVGTPGRILRLVEEGALKVEHLKYLVLDMDRDVKTYCILDMKEHRSDLFNLYRNHIHQLVKEEKTKIVLF